MRGAIVEMDSEKGPYMDLYTITIAGIGFMGRFVLPVDKNTYEHYLGILPRKKCIVDIKVELIEEDSGKE